VAALVDIQGCVEEELRSFEGFQGKGATDNQLNIYDCTLIFGI